MIVILLIGLGFYQLAKRRGLNPILWAVIACASYFAGQFIALYGADAIAPRAISSQGSAMGVSFGGAIAAVIIVWISLEQVARKNKQREASAELLDDDDQYLERL